MKQKCFPKHWLNNSLSFLPLNNSFLLIIIESAEIIQLPLTCIEFFKVQAVSGFKDNFYVNPTKIDNDYLHVRFPVKKHDISMCIQNYNQVTYLDAFLIQNKNKFSLLHPNLPLP